MLTTEAKIVLLNYFRTYPDVLTHETVSSGINPIFFPDTFMQYELLVEPEHKDILKLTQENNGIISAEILAKWIEENFNQRNQGWEEEDGLTGGKIRLDAFSRHLLLTYLFQNPKARDFEFAEHHIDPILYPEEFFRVEILTEPEHEKILHLLEESGGLATKPIVIAWIQENQNYLKKFAV